MTSAAAPAAASLSHNEIPFFGSGVQWYASGCTTPYCTVWFTLLPKFTPSLLKVLAHCFQD